MNHDNCLTISDVDNDGESHVDSSSGSPKRSRSGQISAVGSDVGDSGWGILSFDANGMARSCVVAVGIEIGVHAPCDHWHMSIADIGDHGHM